MGHLEKLRERAGADAVKRARAWAEREANLAFAAMEAADPMKAMAAGPYGIEAARVLMVSALELGYLAGHLGSTGLDPTPPPT